METDLILETVDALGFSRLTRAQVEAHAAALTAAMAEWEINTALRQAAFLAQTAHETGGWRWLRELGGRSYFFKYEGRKDLGNNQLGDGYRFRGRGYIQLTGRHNYRHASAQLGIPLLEHPELAEQPEYAARIAGWYWFQRALNRLADTGEFRQITRVINGGYNGLQDRERKYNIAKRILLGGMV
jgi:predicted chitinase